jgi:uncharacterized protein (TIGR03067 family)
MPRRITLLPLIVMFISFGWSQGQDTKRDESDADKKKADAVKKEQQRLQGTWEVLEYVINGEVVPAEAVKTMRVVFTGDQMSMSLAKAAGKREYTFTVDPAQKPKVIETSPTIAKSKTKMSSPGIYELDGDKLKLCLSRLGSKDRPGDFESSEGSGNTLLVLRRAKK